MVKEIKHTLTEFTNVLISNNVLELAGKEKDNGNNDTGCTMKKEIKHTPGPWKKVYRGSNEMWTDFVGVLIGDNVIEFSGSKDSYNNDADATLIASAPDLAIENEKLKSALEMVKKALWEMATTRVQSHEDGCDLANAANMVLKQIKDITEREDSE